MTNNTKCGLGAIASAVSVALLGMTAYTILFLCIALACLLVHRKAGEGI
jgi:hypothetical protein